MGTGLENNRKEEHNVAIVLAAGKGSRMHSQVHKQYLSLGGQPVLCHSLSAFETFPGVQEVILVTGKEEMEYCQGQIVEAYGFRKVTKVIAGGAERYHSVFRGLQAVEKCDYVFIHDGARPFVDETMLQRALAGVRQYKACVVGMPVKDTIKVSDCSGFAAQTPDRSSLWMIQTPQVFSYSLIKTAYEHLLCSGGIKVTDDAMVLEQMTGHSVKLIEGSYENIKITTPEDLVIAQALLERKTKNVEKN